MQRFSVPFFRWNNTRSVDRKLGIFATTTTNLCEAFCLFDPQPTNTHREAFRGALILMDQGAISRNGFNGPYGDENGRQQGFVEYGTSHVMKVQQWDILRTRLNRGPASKS